MDFNPDRSKHTQEVFFSRKTKNIYHSLLRSNNSIASQVPYQKHFGMFLDAHLTFDGHVKSMNTKINKTIGLFRELQNILPRSVLIAIHKAFVRTHLD